MLVITAVATGLDGEVYAKMFGNILRKTAQNRVRQSKHSRGPFTNQSSLHAQVLFELFKLFVDRRPSLGENNL